MASYGTIPAMLRKIRASDAAREYERQLLDISVADLSFEDRLSLILDRELSQRESRRTARYVREAGFRLRCYPEEIDYVQSRSVSKQVMSQVLSLSFIRGKHNVLIFGPTGIGKTFLTCAIGMEACRQKISTRYFRVSTLLERLAIARADGSYRSFAQKLSRIELLLLDDWGLSPISVTGSRELLDILDDRVGISSTIISSQLPLEAWHSSMEDGTVADAVLDRVIHDSIRLDLKGESMRKLRAAKHSETGETMK